MAKNVILDPTPIEVLENATFEDLVKMWPKEPTIRQAISERLKGEFVSRVDCPVVKKMTEDAKK